MGMAVCLLFPDIEGTFEIWISGIRCVPIWRSFHKRRNATPEIIQFVMDFGERYGYSFEHEATYDRMCLVNDAVYIAKYATPEWCQSTYGYLPGKNKPDYLKKKGYWTATGSSIGSVNVSLRGSISEEEQLSGALSPHATLSGKISDAATKPPAYPPYTGQYEVTPSISGEQVLETKDRYMTDNLVVLEVPYSEVSNTADGITVYIGKEV